MNAPRWHERHERWLRLFAEIAAIGISIIMVVLSAHGNVGFGLIAGLVACAVLFARPIWPRTVFVLCMPGLAGGPGWGPAVVAAYALGRAHPKFLRAVPWILLASACAAVPVLMRESLGAGQIVLTVTFVLLAAGAPVALGALVTTRQELTSSLHRVNAARTGELYAKEETWRAEERARIAREIHDAVGHHTTLIAVEAAALQASSRDESARRSAHRMRGLAKEALTEIRTTLGLDSSEQATPPHLADMHDLVARVRESGVNVRLRANIAPDHPLQPNVARAAYRVVQEALTNASKHASGAPVTVRIVDRGEVLEITVHNDFGGQDTVDMGLGGSGLTGLSERLRLAGGEFRANPLPDGGFELHAVLPKPRD